MRFLLIACITGMVFSSCKKMNPKKNGLPEKTANLSQYVNPFIGTSKMGHVYPGATVPFGMVQLSPQTNFETMYTKEGKYNK